MNRVETFALGAAVGACTVYLLDPDKGRRRRVQLRDQLVRVGHDLDYTARASSRRVRNRAVGLAHEVKAELTEGCVDDRVLVERVRSALGRTVDNLGSLEVSASDGRVILSGVVRSAEVQDLVRTARSVRGVEHVDNELRVTTGDGGRPELQNTTGT